MERRVLSALLTTTGAPLAPPAKVHVIGFAAPVTLTKVYAT